MFGFGKKKKRTLKSGIIDKEISFMMAVPKDPESIKNPEKIIERLKSNEFFTLENINFDENLVVTISYKDNSYDVMIIPETYDIGPMYKINHVLSEENINALEKSKIGVTVAMKFGESNLDSYHLQLKILYTILPDMIGIIDFSSEKVLSPIWTRLAAESCVPPSPDYIYNVQAISDEDGTVWLHTHGLNRCGAVELEILKSDKENYVYHSYVLEALAKRIISDNKFINEEDGFFVGRMNNGADVIATWIDYREAVKKYNSNMLGGANDRKETHNENTGVVYLYLSEENYNKKKYSHVSEVNEYLSDNFMMMLSDEETVRMSTLAMDRIDYFIDEVGKEDVQGLMKIGLEVDDEYKNEDNTFREHIWFEIKEIDGIKARGILTQEPYYIKNLSAGTEMDLYLKDLTDWILFTSIGEITPDNVYLLEDEN